jgi:uncharacterized membrane protein
LEITILGRWAQTETYRKIKIIGKLVRVIFGKAQRERKYFHYSKLLTLTGAYSVIFKGALKL